MPNELSAVDQQILDELRQTFPQATAARMQYRQEDGSNGPSVTIFRLEPNGPMLHRGQAETHLRRERMKKQRGATCPRCS